MQCFICVMYMMFLCGAQPPKDRETSTHEQPRSLFRDVIESLRIRSQLPDHGNEDDGNNLSQNYEAFNYENEPPRLPTDAEFVPRRNDRIEMPPLKYRFPKSLIDNFTIDIIPSESPKEEIILYIDTNKEKTSTAKPKKPQKRPRPNKNKEENIDEADLVPINNSMAGQSQIGNRESQIVVKPTVIVNLRGTVRHKDSAIKLEGRKSDENGTLIEEPPQNVFNINQEIKLERTFAGLGDRNGPRKNVGDDKGEFKLEGKVSANVENEHDMMMCKTATWSPEKTDRQSRKYNSVLQILFNF